MLYGLGPKAQAVYAALNARIQSGDLSPGMRLPSHTELAREFAVAPLTIRNVLAHLEEQGMIRREQGRGTFVLGPSRGPVGEPARLAAIIDIQQEIAGCEPDVEAVMRVVVRRVNALVAADLTGIALIEGNTLEWKALDGPLQEAARARGMRAPLSASLVGPCVERGAVTVCDDVTTQTPEDSQVRVIGIHSFVTLPLHRDGGVVGVLGVASGRSYAFSQSDVQTLHLMTRFIEVALAGAAEFEARQQALHDLLLASEALRESEQRFQALYRRQPTPIYVWRRSGDDWVFIDYNNAAERATRGYVAEAMGRTASEYFRHIPVMCELMDLSMRSRTPLYRELSYVFPTNGQTYELSLAFSFVPPDLLVVQAEDISARKRAEAALLHSTVERDRILTHVVEAIVLHDADGRVVYANPAATRILGSVERPAQEEEYRRTWMLLYPDGTPIPAEERPSLRALRGEEIRGLRVNVRRADGHHAPLSVNSTALRDENGTVIGAVTSFRDITERLLAQEEVRASQERFRSSFQYSASGMEVCALDGRYLEVNPAMTRILGYSQEEFLQRTFYDITYPDDMDLSARQADRLVAGEVAAYDIEKRYIHRDGHPVWVNLTTSLIRDASGRAVSYISQVQDISERKRTEAALRASEQRYRGLFENAQEVIYIIDLDGNLVAVNRAASELMGYDTSQLVGQNLNHLLVSDDVPRAREMIARKVSNHLPTSFEIRVLDADGRPRLLSVHSRIIEEDGRPALIQGIARDITEQRSFEEQLRHQALHDTLTGLPNRALMNDRLRQAIADARHEPAQVALLLMDLDRFKEINDTFGHLYGDMVLEEIGERLRGVVRDVDTVARLGGDEFAFVLPRSDVWTAIEVSGAIQERIAAPLQIDGHPLTIEASIGIALFPDHGEDVTSLMRRADVAMYASKRSDLPYAVYTSESDDYSPERLVVASDMRFAMERDELYLNFQPIVDVRSGQTLQVEALARWIHPRYGAIPPDQFIALAEHTGMIRPLSLLITRLALSEVARWWHAGVRVPVAVNLSVRNLHDPELAGALAALLEVHDLPGEALVVEITESAIMADSARALETLQQMRALGLRIAIDDFGTGYSSLAYLRRLPVSEVKIDRSFLSTIHAGDAVDLAIVRSVIDLGHNLGLTVVAEGIETSEVLSTLAALNCDGAQGHAICPPLPTDDLRSWIAVRSESISL